jgi:hypothetical protein
MIITRCLYYACECPLLFTMRNLAAEANSANPPGLLSLVPRWGGRSLAASARAECNGRINFQLQKLALGSYRR